eukprot:gene6719-10884_t
MLKVVSSKNFSLLFLFVVSHYMYKTVQSAFNLSTVQTTIMMTVFNFFFYYWVMAIIFEVMDRNCGNLKKKYKYKEIRSKYTFTEMAIKVLTNQIIQVLVVVFILSKSCSENFDFSGWGTLKSNVFFFFVIDLFFGGGHYILHFPSLYKPIHSLHHATYSSQGVSAHFMTFVDFIFESMTAAILMSISLFFGFSPIALVSWSAVSSYQTVVDHSGWNLPLNKDPLHHYLHHNYRKKIVNFGLGPIEQILGIWSEPEGIEKEKYISNK